MNKYECLKKNSYISGKYSINTLRFEDRHDIMNWRNEQMYHLRQTQVLNINDQNKYFKKIVSKQFSMHEPNQILFSFLENNKCIGYGGLVHLNWKKKDAEISFIMDTKLEKKYFNVYWSKFLFFIEKVAFNNLNLIRIFTHAYNLRPHLYDVLLKNFYLEESIIKSENLIKSNDVYIHSKISKKFELRNATIEYIDNAYKWLIDPVIRKHSFDKSKSNFESHYNWFNEKINNKNCYYFLSFYENNICGSIRFDKTDCGYKISYLIDKEFHRMGFGKIILRFGVMHLKNKIKKKLEVYGDVHNDNIASIKIFQSLLYKRLNLNESEIRFKKTII